MLKTPETVNQNILFLLKEMSLFNKPVFVPVIPESYAQLNSCFPNVNRKVKNDAGRLMTGWALWENEFMVEAEFHGIWQSPSGELIDITPKGHMKKECSLSKIL